MKTRKFKIQGLDASKGALCSTVCKEQKLIESAKELLLCKFPEIKSFHIKTIYK